MALTTTTNELAIRFSRGEFGKEPQALLESEMWQRDLLDSEQLRTADPHPSHRWTYKSCQSCHLRLPLADRGQAQCRDCRS